MSERPSSEPRLFDPLFAVVAAIFGYFLARNIAWHLRFEDALIVLRYARNLVEGEGFVFNAGERVLGVTTPLHTLLSTAWVGLAAAWDDASRAPALQNVAGVVALLLEAWIVTRLVRRACGGTSAYGTSAAVFAALLVVGKLNRSYLYLGMEVHLFAFLVLLAFDLWLAAPAGCSPRRETAIGVVLGVAFLTRYDAALPAALLGLGILMQRRPLSWRRLPWRMSAAFFALAVPWLVFAELYFGSILPNALSAKEGFAGVGGYLHQVFFYYKATFKELVGLYVGIEVLRAGASYLYVVALALGAAAAIRKDRRWTLLAVYPLLHVTTYAAIGSDPGFRWHYYLLNPLGFLFFALGLATLVSWLASRWSSPDLARRLGAAMLLVLALPPAVHLVRGVVFHVHRPDAHTVQLTSIAEWLDARYGAETSLLQPSIGILGWGTRLRFVDHAGLVTPGLYFYDDARATPLAEVLDVHAPDLVLLSPGQLERPDARGVLAARGYELRHVFDRGPVTYRLFARPLLFARPSERHDGRTG